MELRDLLVEHDYYASPVNYDNAEAGYTYNNWKEFYDIFKDADISLNLVYRWDLTKDNDQYELQVVHIDQRKGIYRPMFINNIVKENVDEIEQYLTAHFEYISNMWQPISNKFAGYD